MLNDYVVLMLMSFLAIAMGVWYFRERRELIRFISDVIKELEDVFKPTDKVYELLGYLVGFKARFKLGRSSNMVNVYAMLTTVPTYSLLYYPIAKALSRKNLLSIAVEFRGLMSRELHIVRKGSKRFEDRLRVDVPHIGRMYLKEVTLSGKTYRVYYEDPRDVDVVLNELKGLNDVGLDIIQISIFKSKSTIYVVTEARRGIVKTIHKFINTVYTNVK
ncbi:MAG: hypothetical protein QXD16_04380 [Sulfolobales archaeon]